MKKIPMRKCVATNQSFPKKELLRVVRNKDLGIIVDLTGKVNGKGAYIQKSEETLDIAIKKKALSRVLETDISNEIYEQIREIIRNQ